MRSGKPQNLDEQSFRKRVCSACRMGFRGGLMSSWVERPWAGTSSPSHQTQSPGQGVGALRRVCINNGPGCGLLERVRQRLRSLLEYRVLIKFVHGSGPGPRRMNRQHRVGFYFRGFGGEVDQRWHAS